MQSIVISENRSISYEDYGQGPMLVLIPGSLATSNFWRGVGQQLSPRFRVVAPNLPGFGGSHPRPEGIRPTTHYVTTGIEKLLNFLDEPVIVCGHSYGGNVALDTVIRKQVPILGLVLFEPVAFDVLLAIGQQETYSIPKCLFDNYQHNFKNGDVQAVRQIIEYWFGDDAFDRLPDKMKQYLIDHTAANILDVEASFDQKISIDELQDITVPVTAVYGGESHDASIEMAKAIASHVQNGLVIKVEDANHGMVNTHPDTIAEIIANHADRCLKGRKK
jgi:pimeloyl-ACP methyl ester carboxylesterase